MYPHGRIWFIVGTRPECIKQAPVCAACRSAAAPDLVSLVGTGQHRELLQTALEDFGLRLDANFDIMKKGQSLPSIMAAVLTNFEALATRGRPDWVVVQGDTTTACAAALAAAQMGIKIAHNEAGLRTYDAKNPFPEEANRRVIASLADLHFAPTERARTALLGEGIADSRIHVVGNPGIDSFLAMLEREPPAATADLVRRIKGEGQDIVLLTAHRREAKGRGMDHLFRAMKSFLTRNPSYSLVYPVHPNDISAAAAESHIASLAAQTYIVPAMDYASLCHVLSVARLVVTDSGGIQEEAATLGIPTVVCRRVTERQEAIELGIARVAGLDERGITESLEWAHELFSKRQDHWDERPFGDGASGPRIAEILLAELAAET